MAVVITRISPNLIFFFFSPLCLLLFRSNSFLHFCCEPKTKMATLQSLVFSTKISHRSPGPPSLPGLATGSLRCVHSSFTSQSLHMFQSRVNASKQTSRVSRLTVMMAKPTIQFIQGTDELTVPDVKLTKSRDGTNGMAIFKFDEPSVFDSSGEVGDITGMYLIDEEGVLQSVDVNAKFVNGKPAGIEAKYIMRTSKDWDRFMRFMERYANQNGLQFIKK